VKQTGHIGRITVINQHDKLSYLNEHISYEVIMLNYTFMRLMTFKPATAENELDRRRSRLELGRVPVKEGAGD
jgi:hypothetical protein